MTNRYNKELIFDIVLAAFYKNDIKELAEDPPYAVDYVITPIGKYYPIDENLFDETGTGIVDEDDEVVYVDSGRGDEIETLNRLNYLAVRFPEFTISEYRNEDFLDWYSSDDTGVDANAYMLTGYETLNDIQRQKQSPYIICHFRRTEDGFTSAVSGQANLDNSSSCLMQSQWNFADSASSGKFGPQQQVYRILRPYISGGTGDDFDYGFSVITTKNKVRGRGRALSLLFSTEAGKDLKMFGWGVKYSGAENV